MSSAQDGPRWWNSNLLTSTWVVYATQAWKLLRHTSKNLKGCTEHLTHTSSVTEVSIDGKDKLDAMILLHAHGDVP